MRERAALWEPSRDERCCSRRGSGRASAGSTAWRDWRRSNPDIDVLDLGSYRLLPLAYRNLGPLLADDPDAGRLKGVYRRSWADNQLVLKGGRRAIAALREAGLEVLALKGGALIASAYRDVGARPMSDLDLAVRSDAVAAAVAALEAAGFEPSRDQPARALRVHHSVGFKDAEEREIDLHRGTLWRAGLDQDFWQAAVPVEVGGAPVLTLCPGDQLLHVCVHGAGWNPVQPFRWVADAYKVLEAAGEALDWDRLVALATRGRVSLPLCAALSYLADELDAPVPAATVEELAAIPVTHGERRAHEALAQPPVVAALGGDALVVPRAPSRPGGPRRDRQRAARDGPLPAGVLGAGPRLAGARARAAQGDPTPGLSRPGGAQPALPPANLTKAGQEGLGTKPGPNRPEPSQKLQLLAWSSTENQ